MARVQWSTHQLGLEAAQVVPAGVLLQAEHGPLEVVLAGGHPGVHLALVQVKRGPAGVLAQESPVLIRVLADGQVEVGADLGHRGAVPVPEGVEAAGVEAGLLLHLLEAVLAGVHLRLTAVGPWQLWVDNKRSVAIPCLICYASIYILTRGEAGEGVVDGPGDDEVVVDSHQKGDEQHSVAKSLIQAAVGNSWKLFAKVVILA